VIDEAERRVNSHLEVSRLVNNSRTVELLVSILLTPEERKLLMLQRTNVIFPSDQTSEDPKENHVTVVSDVDALVGKLREKAERVNTRDRLIAGLSENLDQDAHVVATGEKVFKILPEASAMWDQSTNNQEKPSPWDQVPLTDEVI
jgi:hypothetical protein